MYSFTMNNDIKEEIFTHYGHCKTRIRYHLIFVTKYRRKCLNDIREAVFESFREAANHSHIKIHNMNIDKDHIHAIVSFPPEYSLSQTVNRLKQYTTLYLYRHQNEHLRRFYWSKKKILWDHSYFCSTLGLISESRANEYINNQ